MVKKKIGLVLFGLLSLNLFLAACGNTGPEFVAFPAPDFSLSDLQGNTVKLSQFRGKPVLINFWATWCAPCKEELPLLEKIYQANKNQLEILGVDIAEENTKVEAKVKEVGLSYTTLLDPYLQVTNQYKVTAYPTSIFVDKDGMVQAVKLGAITDQTSQSYLDKILK
jgi:cytochrome c biogenesis protein CcmG/thiol:disulfide interchange protein DsbE